MNSEKKRIDAAEQEAERYIEKYRPWMESVQNHSPLARARQHGCTAIDMINLGQMLEQYENYQAMVEADGNMSHLGTIPNVAMDILSVNFGASPINVIASVQPMEDLQGFVAFKDWTAQNTRGNVTSGQKILSTLAAPDVYPNGYMTDTFQLATLVNASIATQSYSNITVNSGQDYPGPIDPRRCIISGTVVVAAGTCVFSNVVPDPTTGDFSQMAQASSSGTYVGIHGNVNFATGVVTSLEITAAPVVSANSTVIKMNYNSMPEANADMQKAILTIQTKPIAARFFALKATFGTAEKFLYGKRYKMNLDQEVANDLTVSINQEIMNTAMSIISANIPNANVNTWSRTPGSGVSYFEHLPTLKYALEDNSALMVATAGRGAVNTLIAGRQAAAILATLPGFVKVFDDNSFGPHIYGTLNGMTVVRVPASAVLDELAIVGLYQGSSNYEAPLCYSPLMPLFVTDTMQMGFNPLQNQRAAATWAGLDSLIPNLSTRLDITQVSFAY